MSGAGQAAQIAQLAGAALVLCGFGASQLGWMTTRSAGYQAVNLLGSLILTAVAVAGNFYGFVLLNGVWAVVSLIALMRIVLGKGGPHDQR